MPVFDHNWTKFATPLAMVIEALLMIMTCSLMVYAGIEHLIRKRLAEQDSSFPDMKKKPTQRPTARWVFFCF
jgi:transposase